MIRIINYELATRNFGDSFNCSIFFWITKTQLGNDFKSTFNDFRTWLTCPRGRIDAISRTATREIIRSDETQLPCGPGQGLIYRFAVAFSRSLQYEALLLVLLYRLLFFITLKSRLFACHCLHGLSKSSSFLCCSSFWAFNPFISELPKDTLLLPCVPVGGANRKFVDKSHPTYDACNWILSPPKYCETYFYK